MQTRGQRIFFISFLLAVYLFSLNCITVGRHTHVLADGSVISHIHPFDNKQQQPLNNHSHSGSDSDYFNCTTFDFQENLFFSPNFQAPLKQTQIFRIFNPSNIRSNVLISVSLRAPPAA